uniref:CFI-box-CTERM domain-containing protein n=1 Tax=Rheinheimera sp. TaxID=1869214 RepID=UPI004047B47B
MSYPTLEQYNEAFQHPELALTDPELKKGSIATTGLGLPLALCGGFALTYTLKSGTKKHAVRCFHKQSNALEKRYISISNRLRSLKSNYFVEFEFQPQGVRVAGKSFPIVKMAWASGTTLGEFLETNYKNPNALNALLASLRSLAKYLESQGMAHGDIQPGNVMVADSGKKVQLIDYDGMFVDELRSLGSAELGHRNFQHPKRVTNSWNASLDRFSFITLDISLRALASHPELWTKTHSDGDSVLFKANDFADPTNSSIFSDLSGRSGFTDEVKNFAATCRSDFEKVPTLDDFIARKNIPQISVSISKKPESAPAQYLSAFPVLDATNYSACLGFVGDKVELIGKIVEVRRDNTRHGKPYIFINFGPWQGHIVKVSIWSEGLAAISTPPTESWVGKWISVVGLMEPPYVSRRYKYSHLSISITQGNQFHVVSEKEAKFRLAGSSTRSNGGGSRSLNRDILDGIKGNSKSGASNSRTSNASGRSLSTSNQSSNQALLQKMKGTQPSHSASSQYSQSNYKTQPAKSSSNCFIATAVYGSDAAETNLLRRWRDEYLYPTLLGRIFIRAYYFVSPFFAAIISKSPALRGYAKRLLDQFVSAISNK